MLLALFFFAMINCFFYSNSSIFILCSVSYNRLAIFFLSAILYYYAFSNVMGTSFFSRAFLIFVCICCCLSSVLGTILFPIVIVLAFWLLCCQAYFVQGPTLSLGCCTGIMAQVSEALSFQRCMALRWHAISKLPLPTLHQLHI